MTCCKTLGDIISLCSNELQIYYVQTNPVYFGTRVGTLSNCRNHSFNSHYKKAKKKSPWCLKMPCIDDPFKRKADMVVGCATHKSLDNFRASSNQKYSKGRKSHTISIKMSEAFKEQRVHIAGQ